MRYVRAQDIFPAEVLELIQQYADGQYVYIPRREGEKKAWGEQSQTRRETARRNRDIYAAHRQGATVLELAAAFFLSEKSIRRILLEQRRSEQEG